MLATTLFATLALVAGVNAVPHGALRSRSDLHSHGRRGAFSGDGTFYDAGLGACGETNSNEDDIVALNAPQYDSKLSANGWQSEYCGKYVSITMNGKTLTAKVADKCPECAWGSLDMSRGLFAKFADAGVGRAGITWDWVDGPGGDAPADTGAPPVTNTPTTDAPPQTPTETATDKPTDTPTETPTATSDAPTDTPASSNGPATGAPTGPATTDGPAATDGPAPPNGINTDAPLSAPLSVATGGVYTGGPAATDKPTSTDRPRKCRPKKWAH